MSEIMLGKRIRMVRKKAGCSQKEFCSVLDIPQSTLSAYETDRMQPTVASLVNIATKFNVSLDWLCGIDEKGHDFGANFCDKFNCIENLEGECLNDKYKGKFVPTPPCLCSKEVLDEEILDEIADVQTLMAHLSKISNRLEWLYKRLGEED